MSDNSINPQRFKKIDDIEARAGKFGNWPMYVPVVDRLMPGNAGEFLSKIWAHYGPPISIDFEGFTYCFKDTKNDKNFCAYCGPSGPAFSGHYRDFAKGTGFTANEAEKQKLEDSVRAFETLLHATQPTDCEIEFDTDFGPYRVGAKDGFPFQEEIK